MKELNSGTLFFRIGMCIFNLILFQSANGANRENQDGFRNTLLQPHPPQEIRQDCSPPMGYRQLSPGSRFFVSDVPFLASKLPEACSEPQLKIGSIRSDEENEEVTQYLIQSGEQRGLWIDVLMDSTGVNGLTSLQRRPLVFSRFYEGEPNNRQSEFPNACVYITYVSTNSPSWPHLNRNNKALWNDVACNYNGPSHLRPTLCECRSSRISPGSMTPMHENDLRQLGSSGFFYSNFPRPWNSGMEMCDVFGMLPGVIDNATELDKLRMSLVGSPVAYSFLWVGAKVDGKMISWLNPEVKYQPELKSVTEIQINSCLNIGVGNKDALWVQSQDCSIPLHFLCKKSPPDREIPKCKSKESFRKVKKGLWFLEDSKFTFESALSCCKTQNLSLVSAHYIFEQKDQLIPTLQNNGIFWAQDESGSGCVAVNYTTSLHMDFPLICSNVFSRVLCQENTNTTQDNRNPDPIKQNLKNINQLHGITLSQTFPVTVVVKDQQNSLATIGGTAPSKWTNDLFTILFPIIIILLLILLPVFGVAASGIILALAVQELLGFFVYVWICRRKLFHALQICYTSTRLEMSRRAYDYATPSFGGDYCCAPPPLERPSNRPDAAYRSLQKQNSILQQSLTRADSGGRGQLSRMESLSSRSPLARGNSATSRTSETYSTTSSSSGGGAPTSFSSTTYKSPYGNTYRSCSKF